jgi:hypothetical protein
MGIVGALSDSAAHAVPNLAAAPSYLKYNGLENCMQPNQLLKARKTYCRSSQDSNRCSLCQPAQHSTARSVSLLSPCKIHNATCCAGVRDRHAPSRPPRPKRYLALKSQLLTASVAVGRHGCWSATRAEATWTRHQPGACHKRLALSPSR